jgi:hypothetical protein
MGVEEVSSQNGAGVQEPAEFFERSSETFGAGVTKVLGKGEKVAPLLDGLLPANTATRQQRQSMSSEDQPVDMRSFNCERRRIVSQGGQAGSKPTG